MAKAQRRKPKQKRSLEKYNAVLEACTRILSVKGYSKTTITEISLECNLPYATIYQYFEGKDDILLAWIEQLIDRIGDQLTNQVTHVQSEKLPEWG